ncbi:MAG: hypothetical protein NT091_01000 [Candidatus Falkowbacteria bacterium]|nr:hypothetical protein [Candidatus Falkowbacteria bacterium]
MGSVNLAEAIEMSKETKDVINLNDSAEVRVNRTMGALFGVSDKEMGNNKKLFKEKLNKSNDSTERSLALIYSRTDSEREAMKRMKEINDEIAQKVKELENVKQVLMEHVENVAFLEEHTDDTHRLLESTLKENRALSAENAQLKEKVINIQTELNGCETKLARQNIQDMAQ